MITVWEIKKPRSTPKKSPFLVSNSSDFDSEIISSVSTGTNNYSFSIGDENGSTNYSDRYFEAMYLEDFYPDKIIIEK